MSFEGAASQHLRQVAIWTGELRDYLPRRNVGQQAAQIQVNVLRKASSGGAGAANLAEFSHDGDNNETQAAASDVATHRKGRSHFSASFDEEAYLPHFKIELRGPSICSP